MEDEWNIELDMNEDDWKSFLPAAVSDNDKYIHIIIYM